MQLATVWKMGHDNGLWEATLRTDYELISKKPRPRASRGRR
jgi:hypothetical protein